VLDEQGELFRVASVRADAAVGAEGNLDAAGGGALERRRPAVERLQRLGGDLGRILSRRLPAAGVLAGHQRRYQIGAALVHHLHGLVVEKRTVLD
jgi:hypothetical protein